MINKQGLVSLLLMLLSSSLYGGEIVLSGSYQGKDLFVQNPFNRSTSTFCTREVHVNDRLVLENPNVSAFKVDLSFLSINDLVVVRITFEDGCEPSIVNPHSLKSPQDFQFLTTQVDHNSITWSTKGDKRNGKYFVEHKTEKKEWQPIDSVEVRGEFDQNKYAVPPAHVKGENKYRVVYSGVGSEPIYSVEVLFTASDNYITFYPHIATTQLRLSDSTAYEVMDYFGKVVKKGAGRDVILLGMKSGKYYLNIQNRQEIFIIK